MSSKSIDELLEKYDEGTLELLFVTDFYIRKEPFYFKVICKFTSISGKIYYPVADVAPDELHKKYKIGSKYINGIQSKAYASEVIKRPFLLHNIDNLIMYKLSDVINNTDKQVLDTSLNNYILKQNCYFIEDDDFDIIIPHYTIANHFNFKSSSLKNAILNNTLDYLYKKNSFRRIDNNNVSLHIKSQTNLSDLKTICHFLENKKAWESFTYYIRQRARGKELIQIQSIFPFSNSLSIRTLCKNISSTGKPKFLILGIYKDYFKYDFKNVDYIYDDSKDINNIDFNPNGFSQDNPIKNTNKVKNTTPTTKYINKHNTFIDDDFKEDDNIILTPIINDVSSNQPKIINDIEKEVDGSLKKSEKDGDENTQQITISSTTIKENTNEKEIFEIEQFEQLYKSLINGKYITSHNITELKELSPKTDSKNHISSKYFLLEDKKRRYCSSTFKFNDKHIGFIELEHSTNWHSISTWFFISNDFININEDFINDIVFTYIRNDENNTLKDIAKELEKINISFLRKTHPSEMNEKTIKDWVKNLLLRLNKI